MRCEAAGAPPPSRPRAWSTIRRGRGRPRRELLGPARPDLRVPRAQRRRQVDHHLDAVHAAAAQRRACQRGRLRCGRAPGRGAPTHRAGVPGHHPGRPGPGARTETGIYARLSFDKQGTSTATERQIQACRQLVDANGLHVRDVYEDREVSAYQLGVIRPQFERLLSDLDQGLIQAVVVWKVDRLARRLEDLLRVSRILDTRGAALISVTESLDTSTASGRFMLRTMVGLAEMESANISLRTAAQRAEAARKGRPNVGGARPFGYAADKTTIIPEEAEAVRQAIRRFIAGEGVRGIAMDFNRRGILSRRAPGAGRARTATACVSSARRRSARRRRRPAGGAAGPIRRRSRPVSKPSGTSWRPRRSGAWRATLIAADTPRPPARMSTVAGCGDSPGGRRHDLQAAGRAAAAPTACAGCTSLPATRHRRTNGPQP